MRCKSIISAAILGLSLCVPIVSLGQSIDYAKITAQGIGPDYANALGQALAQAVGQVNGADVANRIVTESVKARAAQITATQGASVTGANGQGQGLTTTAGVELQAKEFAADRTTVTLSTETSGVINRYQVTNYQRREDGWHVSVLAEIARYKASETSTRLKVAVLPFKLTRADESARTFERSVRSDLVARLSQTGKFAVLDREFSDDQQAELNFLRGEGVKRDELAKLGNRLGSDFIVVGVINDASTRAESAQFQTLNRTVSGPPIASAKISYRVIELATGVIQLADAWQSASRTFSKLEDLGQQASDSISRTITEALFPLRVERIADGIFYIGQGGKAVQVGQRFTVLQLGQAIVSSDTQEIIGREEREIGTVEITEVLPKLAKAKLMDAAKATLPTESNLLILRVKATPAASAQKPTPTASKATQSTGAQELLKKKEDDY